MKERVGLKYKGKKIFLEVYEGNKVIGLMFKKKEHAKALIFNIKGRKSSLHSFFVFFPFLALWLDDKNKILEKKIVSPFSFNVHSKKPFSKIIEIPFNSNYKGTIKKIDNTVATSL